MSEIQSPTAHILKAAAKSNCQVPLIPMEKCPYKYCTCKSNNEISELQIRPLEDDDDYWCEFLKSQSNSTANYIYKIKTFGSAQDPTLLKQEPFVTTEAINQRVVDMSYTGGLLKTDLFYLLSFVLHLVALPVEKQKLYVEHLLKRKILDMEIINYLQMISRHANAGLTDKQIQEFRKILLHTRNTNAGTKNISYYNPDHIFLKSPNGINPYEEEYLRSIFTSKKKLTFPQTLYLAKLVYRLQQLDKALREEQLEFLRKKCLLPFRSFEYLLVFLVTRAKRIDGEKLKNLLRELQNLVGTGPCEPESPTVTTEIKKDIQKTEIEIDYLKIDKALGHLMECVIPNIVRLNDLKSFLTDMMSLSEDQALKVFNSLKIANIMTKQRFNFVENFIKAGRLGKSDKTKRQRFLEMLKNVAESPASEAQAMINLVLPASKGPIKEQVYSTVVEEVAEVRTSSTETDKNEEETKQRSSAIENGNRNAKKIAKRQKKSLKKRTAKKKK